MVIDNNKAISVKEAPIAKLILLLFIPPLQASSGQANTQPKYYIRERKLKKFSSNKGKIILDCY